MTPAAVVTEYGGLIFDALFAPQVGIRAITRNAPASSIPSTRLCCRP